MPGIPKKTKYQEYLDNLARLLSSEAANKAPCIVIVGEPEYLVEKALLKLKATWCKKQKASATLVDVDDLTDDKLMSLWEQCSLFASSELNIIHNIDKFKSLDKVLEKLGSKSPKSGFILISNKKKLPSAQEKALKAKGFKFLSCVEPRPYEFNRVLPLLTKEVGVNLKPDAMTFLLDLVGADICLLDNELRSLKLIFGDHEKLLGTEDINHCLTLIKDEEVFGFTELLLNGRHTAAENSLEKMLQKGQSALGILALLARHCRQAILVKEGLNQCSDIYSLSKTVNMPPFVVKKYIPYVQKKKLDAFVECLRRCFELDVAFKTSRLSPHLLLSQLISIIA